MRTQTTVQTIYKFSELSEKAKSVAIENERRYQSENMDPDLLIEVFTDALQQKGLPVDDIRFSLNRCQGDGVAFYGILDIIDFKSKNPDTIIPDDIEKIEITKRSAFHMYDHENTMEVNAYSENDSDRFEKEFRTFLKDISLELSQKGYEILDYEQSESYITQTIEANDMEFLENGDQYY